jgi:DNA-directed RNA polymerase subunit K/omega
MSEKKNTKKESKTQTSDDVKLIDNESDYDDISINSDPDADWNEEEELDIDKNNTDNDEDICIYNNVHKSRSKNRTILALENDSDSNSDDDDDNIENNEHKIDISVYVKPEERCSGNILTKYEVVRILSERTSQLSYGAKPMLNGVNGLPPRMIAQLELESKMIPLKVVRPLPNGMKEIWSIDELILKDIHIVYGFKGGKIDKTSLLTRQSTSTISDNLY